MAWDDVLQSFVQTAGTAFQSYNASQATPFVLPPGASVQTTANGAAYIQQSNTTMWLIIGLAVIAVIVLLFLRR